MSAQQFIGAIEARFTTAWNAAHPTVPIAYSGKKFQPPANSPWVRITVVLGNEEQVTFGAPGGNTYRLSGTIYVDVFGPKGTGMGTVNGLADTARTTFRGAQFDGVMCRAATVIPGEEAAYVTAKVRIPFQVDAIY